MASWTGGAADRAALGKLVRHARAARRLRLEVPGLVGNEILARRLERSVSTQDGVATVHADTRTGRVLITYHAGAPIFDRLAALTSNSVDPGDGPLGPANDTAPVQAHPPAAGAEAP